jgi:hypothetical protein
LKGENKIMMDRDQILDAMIELRDSWYEIEKYTGEVAWGECAYDLDELIETAAGEK